MLYPHKQQGFSNREPLTYGNLDHGKKEIRVITILPGSWRARIRCTLTTVSLNDDPIYNALSYVWGDPYDTVPIFVDGKVFHATVSLWRALRRIRRPTSPFAVWIDAICINQKDGAEKSVQVAMMGDIYSKCSWSIVWLGEDPSARKKRGGSRPQSKTFRLAAQLLRILAQGKHYSEYPCYKPTSDGAGIAVVERYQHHFKGLEKLLASEWWHRIWVVQEIVLPQRVVFVASSEMFSISYIEKAYVQAGKHGMDCCRWAWQKLHSPAPSGEFFKAIVDLVTVFRPFASAAFHRLPGSELSLRTLRATCGDMKPTVPHDYIYGLLGLVTSWGSAAPPRPDYTRPMAETFAEAVLSMVGHEEDFCAMHGSRESDDRDGIPSWIPDYVIGRDERSTSYPLLDSFGVSGAHFETPRLVDGLTIQVKAIRIDQVDRIGRTVTNPDTLCPCLEEWREIFAGEKPQPKMEQFWKALLRATLSSSKLRQTHACDWSRISWSVCEEDYQRFRKACAEWLSTQDGSKGLFVSLLSQYKTGAAYKEAVSKKMFFTKTGKLGLARYPVREEDEIYLPIGGKAPFILRKSAVSSGTDSSQSIISAYEVISECFLEGVMDGELMERKWEAELEDILFV